jgi:hypothetical protein
MRRRSLACTKCMYKWMMRISGPPDRCPNPECRTPNWKPKKRRKRRPAEKCNVCGK